jgi:putative Mn2+ efflux pump MntP
LAFLGGKMLTESIIEIVKSKKEEVGETCACPVDKKQQPWILQLTLQAVATSIDALAVGVTLQMAAISEVGLALGVWGATGIIGMVTMALSLGAVYIGKMIGDKLSDKAGILGGLVLFAIGIKILMEGLL